MLFILKEEQTVPFFFFLFIYLFIFYLIYCKFCVNEKNYDIQVEKEKKTRKRINVMHYPVLVHHHVV